MSREPEGYSGYRKAEEETQTKDTAMINFYFFVGGWFTGYIALALMMALSVVIQEWMDK